MKMKFIPLLFVGLTAFATAGCPNVVIDPIPPTPVPDPVPPAPTAGDCHAACENLRRLGCDEANPVPTQRSCTDDTQCADHDLTCSGGVCVASCEKFCEDTQDKGVPLDTACVAQIAQCVDIERCDRD